MLTACKNSFLQDLYSCLSRIVEMIYFGIILFAFSTLSVSAEKNWEIFLKNQKTIRLYVADTSGMGHQSHSFKVLERIQELG